MPLRREKGDITVGKPAAAWYVSYSDLMMQILVFFVMLFALGARLTENQLQEIAARIQEYAATHKIESYVSTSIDIKGLTVSLSDRIMFRSGEARIVSPEAKKHTRGIGLILKDYRNSVTIEGHTDNRPIRTKQFPSNWELSTARATNLTRYLIENIRYPSKQLSSAGYAEFHPVVPNTSPEGLARNRRVDLVVAPLSLAQQKELREEKGLVGKEFQ